MIVTMIPNTILLLTATYCASHKYCTSNFGKRQSANFSFVASVVSDAQYLCDVLTVVVQVR